MVTIKEIAERAKVSPATVSRVLKQDQTMSVSPETRENILKIAQHLGYTKHLKKPPMTDVSPLIAIIQWFSESEELDDIYYYSIRISIEKQIVSKGYRLIRSFNDLTDPALQEADGMIAIGKFSPSQIKELAHLQKNLAFVDSDTLSDGFSCVTTDFNRSVVQVIEHFRHQGITDIGLIAGEEKTADRQLGLIDPRFRTFKQHMTDLKLYKARNVYIGDFSAQSGYDLMSKAIAELGNDLPHAFFAASDTLAVGALRALQEANIPVPSRVQLISFNDTAITKQVYPRLSSVTVFTEEMGAQAFDLLSILLAQPQDYHPRMIKLGTQLTIRESSY